MFFKSKNEKKLDMSRIPQHIAIIMDGNGRWARKRGLPRAAGHRMGVETLRKITEHCSNLGVKALTVYAFSTENWSRPKEEVDSIMKLIYDQLKDRNNSLGGKNAIIRFIGDLSRLSDEINEEIRHTEEFTKKNTGIVLTLAVNYGGQDEIVMAARKLAQKAKDGEMLVSDITTRSFSRELYTRNLPEVDLIIRPSGEKRLSNFMLWQAAYAEFWYSNINWPDFKARDIEQAIYDFQNRDRRFGKI